MNTTSLSLCWIFKSQSGAHLSNLWHGGVKLIHAEKVIPSIRAHISSNSPFKRRHAKGPLIDLLAFQEPSGNKMIRRDWRSNVWQNCTKLYCRSSSLAASSMCIAPNPNISPWLLVRCRLFSVFYWMLKNQLQSAKDSTLTRPLAIFKLNIPGTYELDLLDLSREAVYGSDSSNFLEPWDLQEKLLTLLFWKRKFFHARFPKIVLWCIVSYSMYPPHSSTLLPEIWRFSFTLLAT